MVAVAFVVTTIAVTATLTPESESGIKVPDLISTSSGPTTLPFKRVPPEVLPPDASRQGIVESIDATDTSVLFLESDGATQTGTRVRIRQTLGHFSLDIAKYTERVDVHGIEVNLQFGEGYENSFFATWNQGDLGFIAEFLHITGGSEDQLTSSLQEGYLDVVRSLIGRLATT